MGNFKFSMRMLKKEYKKSLVYTLTLALVTAVTFLFFNIIDNPHLMDAPQQTSQWFYTQMPFSTMLSFLIIVFCAFMIVFANNFYVSRKTDEIAIMTMSGSTFINVTLYLIYQNILMTFIAFIIGVILGSGISMCVNQFIYSYIHYQGAFFYIPMNAIFDTIICILAILFGQLVYTSGFVYRKDISYLLSQEKTNISQDKRIFKFPSWIYIVIYLFGVVSLVMSYNSVSAIFPCFIGSMGIGCMIKYNFPKLFHIMKSKKWLADKLKLISLSNLYYSLRRAYILVGLYAVSSSVMIAIMIMQRDNPRELITAFIGFIVVTILILASIIYKYVMEATTRKLFYYNLYKMGYTYRQLKAIIKQEVTYFYSLLFGLPMVIIILSLIQAYLHQDITIHFMIMILAVQIISDIVACVFTYIAYKKNVLKVLEEGVRYE